MEGHVIHVGEGWEHLKGRDHIGDQAQITLKKKTFWKNRM